MTTFTYLAKNTLSFTNLAKNTLSFLRSIIKTDAGDRVLLGSNEDEVLIWTPTTSGWNFKDKN